MVDGGRELRSYEGAVGGLLKVLLLRLIRIINFVSKLRGLIHILPPLMFMLRCCYHCCCAAYFAANNQLTQLLFMCAVCERPSVHVCLCVYICFFRLCLFIEFMTLSLPTLQRQASVHMYVYVCIFMHACLQLRSK